MRVATRVEGPHLREVRVPTRVEGTSERFPTRAATMRGAWYSPAPPTRPACSISCTKPNNKHQRPCQHEMPCQQSEQVRQTYMYLYIYIYVYIYIYIYIYICQPRRPRPLCHGAYPRWSPPLPLSNKTVKASQGQNLALTVLLVPNFDLFKSGRCMVPMCELAGSLGGPGLAGRHPRGRGRTRVWAHGKVIFSSESTTDF